MSLFVEQKLLMDLGKNLFHLLQSTLSMKVDMNLLIWKWLMSAVKDVFFSSNPLTISD